MSYVSLSDGVKYSIIDLVKSHMIIPKTLDEAEDPNTPEPRITLSEEELIRDIQGAIKMWDSGSENGGLLSISAAEQIIEDVWEEAEVSHYPKIDVIIENRRELVKEIINLVNEEYKNGKVKEIKKDKYVAAR